MTEQPSWATRPVLDLNDYLKPGRSAWSDDYQNSKHFESMDCCIVCGKLTAPGKGIQVALGLGGASILHPSDDDAALENDRGYMGWWKIGPECGRNIPADYQAT